MSKPIDREQIRVGLIGFGLAGQVFHAPLIDACQGLALVAIVTANPERRTQAEQRFPETAIFSSVNELWVHGENVDLIVVATPNHAHVPISTEAIEMGFAVVIDKPIAPTAEAARQLISAAKAHDVCCTVFQNRRYDADFRTLRDLVERGELGTLLRLESRFERWRPTVGTDWRERSDPAEAGGILFDLGPHLIDQALVLLGPVRSVYAELDRRRIGAQMDDDAFLSLHHRSGARSHLAMSAVTALPGLRFHAVGNRASFKKSGLDGQEEALRMGRSPHDPGFGIEPRNRWGELGSNEQSTPYATMPGSYLNFYEELVVALRSGGAPPVDPSDALAGIEIIEAARRAASSGEIVELH